jgi:hypothetical protein
VPEKLIVGVFHYDARAPQSIFAAKTTPTRGGDGNEQKKFPLFN